LQSREEADAALARARWNIKQACTVCMRLTPVTLKLSPSTLSPARRRRLCLLFARLSRRISKRLLYERLSRDAAESREIPARGGSLLDINVEFA